MKEGKLMRRPAGSELKNRIKRSWVVNGLIVSAAFLVMQSNAQSASQTATILKTLGPRSDPVIERLSLLNRLPADEWRFHEGDITHGESADLDDSSWEVIKGRRRISEDAVWLRRTVEIPKNLNGYDLTGARI
jgi:alpha-mannosidase